MLPFSFCAIYVSEADELSETAACCENTTSCVWYLSVFTYLCHNYHKGCRQAHHGIGDTFCSLLIFSAERHMTKVRKDAQINMRSLSTVLSLFCVSFYCYYCSESQYDKMLWAFTVFTGYVSDITTADVSRYDLLMYYNVMWQWMMLNSASVQCSNS